MNLTSQLTSLRNESHELSLDERAAFACRVAKQFEKVGEYEAAYEALVEFWPDRSEPPNVSELEEFRQAEVLLRIGALAGWLGGAEQTPPSQETAKNIITKSLDIFQARGLTERVAEARGDLALCYWREGSYDEARVTWKCSERLGDANPELRAILFIRAGVVEMYDQNFKRQFSTMSSQLLSLKEAKITG